MKYEIVKAKPDAVVIDGELEPAERAPAPSVKVLARVDPNALVDGQARPWTGDGESFFSKLKPGLIYKIKFTLHGWNMNYPVDTYQAETVCDWKNYDRPTVTSLELTTGGFVHREVDYRPAWHSQRSPGVALQGPRVRKLGDLRSMLARAYEDLTYRVTEVSWQ